MKLVQEIYCNDCSGYFRVILNTALNIAVKIKCPNCEREHERHIIDGKVYDKFMKTVNWKDVDVIIPMKSTYSKEAVFKKSYPNMRDGMPFGDPLHDIAQDSWNERYGDKL